MGLYARVLPLREKAGRARISQMIRIGVTFLLTGSTGVALRATEIALFQGAMGWALCLYFLLSALVLFVRAFMVYGRPAISRKPSRGMALNTPVLQLAPIRSRS